MTYVIAEPCIGVLDRSCVDVCPVDCIYEGEDQLYIHPDECIDCGACVPECPVTAIFIDDEVPPTWESFRCEEPRRVPERQAAGGAEEVARCLSSNDSRGSARHFGFVLDRRDSTCTRPPVKFMFCLAN